MMRSVTAVDAAQTIVIILEETTPDDALSARLNAAHNAIVRDYRQHKRMPVDQVTVAQIAPSPTSPLVVMAVVDTTAQNRMDAFRRVVAKAVRATKHCTQVQWLCLADCPQWDFHVAQVIAMVEYDPPRYLATAVDPDPRPQHVMVNGDGRRMTDASIIGEAVNKARTFANMPANKLNTTAFVQMITALFEGDSRFSVTILEESDLKKRAMNALLGVAQGSKYPPYLVDISYNPQKKPAVAFVGKGVVFDTGGISLKPSLNMKDMKGDMGGAAAVVSAAWAAGQLNIAKGASFIVPIVENMISKDAQRPGDVVVASNGTHIEISNTDAEGRLILADALVYACEKDVSAVIDIATLTGASTIALGPYATAILGTNQAIIDTCIHAAGAMNEPLWQLPLFDGYKSLLKSDIADILNANEGREAGTITAAMFLRQFVGDTPWAHLDIACTMQAKSTKGEQVKGMTGAGTRALIAFLQAYSSQ